MKISELQRQIHEDNVERGWWEEVTKLTVEPLPLNAANPIHRLIVEEKLALVHSEVSEALEEIREGHPLAQVIVTSVTPGKPLGFPTEIADAVIRLLDLAQACGIDLEAVIDQKLAYNRTRGYKHGGKLS